MNSGSVVTTPRFRSPRISTCVGLALLGVLTTFHAPLRAAIALIAVAPLGASAGVTVQITGSGFAPVAANNQVVITPPTGSPITVAGSSIVVVDAAKDVRRLVIILPAGVPTGNAAVQVRNTSTGEVAGGRSLQVIDVTVPQPVSALRGTTGVAVRMVGSANTAFLAGRTTVIFGSGVTVTATQVVSPAEVIATVSVSATAPLGARTITIATSAQNAQVPAGFQVTDAPPPNRNPVAAASAPGNTNTGAPISFSSIGSTDPDNDSLTFSWDFGDGASATDANPQHAYATAGQYTATLIVSDGRGGTGSATTVVAVTTPVTLLSLVVNPPALRFSDLNTTAALSVTGRYSDGSERDLTGAATGTSYLSSALLVATAVGNGVVTAVGNGGADITISNNGVTGVVPVVVEQGVVLQSLELTPPIVTLRELGSAAPTTLRGSFSDGSLRDLTSDPGTSYSIDEPTIASISINGLVTALAPGAATATALYGGLSATSQVRVIVTDGSGFVRGEVFDDSRGVPLSNATATVLIGGGAPVVAPAAVPADERGHFTVPAASGAALVSVTRAGFTTVERQADLARGSVITLLDSRLTPLDGRVNVLQSVFGGEARSADGAAVVSVPPGSLDADSSLRVTPISNQGLQGRLPTGWSPIAGVDLQPAGRGFSQPATLRLPHPDVLAAGAAAALAIYDATLHRWVVQQSGVVSDDRRALVAPITSTGQYAFIVPDDAPVVPPPAIAGQVLAGVADLPVPSTSTVTGLVVPRSAPPGDGARAVGSVILQPPVPLASGAVLHARVSEQFDLLDSSRVVPPQFVQDVVLYAKPRTGNAGTLSARLPITPSLQFTIQQLSLGTVRLDVTIDEPAASAAIIGGTGGSLTDEAGNVLEIPAGALPADIAIGLLPLVAEQLSAPVPAGFTLLGAVLVDLVGASFGQPALLSIPRPSGLATGAQVLVAQVITDNAGGRRLKIVGLGAMSSSRVTVQTTLGSLTFEGVRSGGEFAFLQPLQPVGFVTGVVNAPVSGAQSLALVTTDTAPFAFLTTAAGTFVVAGRAGAPTNVAAIEPAGAAASGATTVAALNDIVTLNLSLAQSTPVVTATIPARNAVNVALDTSLVIDFSKPIDPATVLASSVILRAGPTVVAATPTLSANRRRLTVTPSPLVGLTVYALTLTSDIHDLAGVALSPFAPLSFTTLDPAKATALALGVVTADLPDEDGLSLVTGAAGATEPSSVVVGTNPRTQETVTVLSAADGSFRLRVRVVVGDEIALTFRDARGRETTIAITQFTAADGLTSIGAGGGSIQGAGGRLGRILPRALTAAGLFAIEPPRDAQPPQLPGSFTQGDRFVLRIDGAAFQRIESLTLTESQARFAPSATLSAPFASSGALTVPADFLVSASLRFTATVVDRDGARRSASGTTMVVASAPDTAPTQTSVADEFPAVFLTVPRQAVPSQTVEATAVAPAARVDLDLPAATPAPPSDHTAMLTRLIAVSGETKLSLVDTLARVEIGGLPRLRTAGLELPGATRAGDYVVVSGPVAFVTGRASGPAAIVAAEGLPFVFETEGANGAFTLPVLANAQFTLRFFDAVTGAALGSTSGQAPPAGTPIDIGRPLAAAGGTLTVSAEPDARSTVDIGALIVFTFSEAVDRSSVTAGAFVVTDPAGIRVFGGVAVSDDGRTVTFDPSRRWRFGTLYRYGVSSNVVAASGARMAQPFSGEFTTFAPSLLGSLALGNAHDVAVTGPLAIVATGSGVAVANVSIPAAPQVVTQIPLAGGARGVAIVPSPLVDRNGVTVSGSLIAVVSGDTTTGGRLQIFDVSDEASPTLIGAAQLTAVPGQTPPPGVPNTPGTPRAIAIAADGRALVAIENVGLVSVRLGQTIPVDPANPGQALAERYPAAGVESIVGVDVLSDRAITVGTAGVRVLDLATLTRRGGTATDNSVVDVAVLSAVSIDLNGDGTVAGDTETFDLAVAAGGADNTLQFFRVPESGDPVLVSVVRLPGEVNGVALDAGEALAYAALGARGIAPVDVLGLASIQPIDQDHNGHDDRILATIDTAGSAEQITPVLTRGIGMVADGAGGLSVIRLRPARVRFLDILRDPVVTITGEEQSIRGSHTAYVTDDGLRLELDADLGSDSGATLAIEEVPFGGGSRLLAFPNGDLAAVLQPGINTIALALDGEGSAGTRARLSVRRQSGEVVATADVSVVPTPAVNSPLETLMIGPSPAVIGADAPDQLQLGVAGVFGDGTIQNVSRAASGTVYRIGRTGIATLNADGMISAVGGGTTVVEAANGSATVSTRLTVERAPTLLTLRATSSAVSLRALGSTQALPIDGTFSDGSRQLASAIAGTTFSSSDPQTASVTAGGIVTAVGAGEAIVSATNGSLQASVTVVSEPRAPPSVASIRIDVPDIAVSVEDGDVPVGATIAGTGSMDGLTVTFTTSGPRVGQFESVTALTGATSVLVDALTTAGNLTVSAVVIDPATGELRSDTRTIAILPPGDGEPNNSIGQASPLSFNATVNGSLSAGGDALDVYRLPSELPGTSSILLTLPDDIVAENVVIVARDAAGAELARFVGQAAGDEQPMVLPAGSVFVSIGATSGAATYEMAVDFDQAPIAVSSVAPSSGPRGTQVTIDGSGFGVDHNDVGVFFGGVRGRIVSVAPTRIQVLVPGNAANGPLSVVVRNREGTGPGFTTGAATIPPAINAPWQATSIVADPASGALTLIDRLTVTADPVAVRAELEAVAARAGASLVGFVPQLHRYVLEFTGNRSLNTLQARRTQLLAEPLVQIVALASFDRLDDVPIDVRDVMGQEERNAFEQIDLFKAIEAVRNSPNFETRAGLRTVRVAVIDDGFIPGPGHEEFESAGQPSAIQVANGRSGSGEHGTQVTSIIGAVNNGARVNGVLNGVLQPDEVPYQVDMYATDDFGGGLNHDDVMASLADIVAGHYDIVSMSFSSMHSDQPLAAFNARRAEYKLAMQPAAERTLFILSGGNLGVNARQTLPCALSSSTNYTICVGGVANATDTDRTHDPDDARAVYPTMRAPIRNSVPCFQRPNEGSGCGPAINIAAPGEDVIAMKVSGAPDFFRGTSAAVPMVAGVAGLVQAIRPDENVRFTPDRLRSLLIATADNISSTWNPGNMRRLNALSAVRAVLGAPRAQKVYVTDDDETARGFVVGIEINPLTGERNPSIADDTRLPLSWTTGGQTIRLLRPSTAVNAAASDRMFVAVETDGFLGDGIAVINTQALKVISFVPLNGMRFPTAAGAPVVPAIKFGSRRPGLVVSKDNRLLYVAAADQLIAINLLTSKVVGKYADLPPPFRPNAGSTPADSLAARLTAVTTAMTNAAVTGSGTGQRTFADVTLSADGKTLYLVVRTGSGQGQQPGFILPVNVDLYRDGGGQALLQSDLSNYLHGGTPRSMTGPGSFLGGDEPSALAASPDGQHLYLVNGGMKEFATIPPAEINFLDRYSEFVNQMVVGVMFGFGGTLGLANSAAAFFNSFPHLVNEMALDLKLQAESGLTLINAAGVTGAFDVGQPSATPGTIGSQQWTFTSDVTFGWNPSAANGGRIINQFKFKEVFAKRPFGISIRPDGRRAILPYFQTGNFAVLDLDTQGLFSNPNTAGVPATLFQGVVGVTPAIRLDNHLWPRRGAYTSGDGVFVPSPDEDLMFPGPIEYAQNGRFAAAIHTGVNRPRAVVARLPDFANNNEERLALNSIGFSVASGASSGTDPSGNPVSSLEPHFFNRGGGALTILGDALIGADLAAHAATSVPGLTGGTRPYFSQHPICQGLDPDLQRCVADVFTRHFGYSLSEGLNRFSRPRGVAIQPFVSLETPRFGDHVSRTSAVRFRWRDTRGDRFRISVHDLGTPAAPLNQPIAINTVQRTLSIPERQKQSIARTMLSLFAGGARPVAGRAYRITAAIVTVTGDELSSTSVDVFFER